MFSVEGVDGLYISDVGHRIRVEPLRAANVAGAAEMDPLGVCVLFDPLEEPATDPAVAGHLRLMLDRQQARRLRDLLEEFVL